MEKTEDKIAEFESRLQTSIELELAQALEDYAVFLKAEKLRLLDASNMMARAQAIRKKLASETQPEEPSSPAGTNDTKQCPFCAELIKSEAIVCRFCHADLIKAKKGYAVVPVMPLFNNPLIKHRTAVIVTGSILSLCVIAFLSIHWWQEMQYGTVEGTAFFSRKNGTSELARDLPVIICGPDVNQENQNISNDLEYASNVANAGGDGIFDPLSARITRYILPHAVTKVSTDVNGKYFVQRLPVGKYKVIAQLDMKHSYLLWYHVVHVKGGQKTTIDLSNSTAERIITVEKPLYSCPDDLLARSHVETEATLKVIQWLQHEKDLLLQEKDLLNGKMSP